MQLYPEMGHKNKEGLRIPPMMMMKVFFVTPPKADDKCYKWS